MKQDTPKRIAVAVQGGGSHGAFSWGVLDRLLKEVSDGKLEIVALSGTSAGGFNATLCAYALGMGGDMTDRAIGAGKLLEEYWLSDAADAPANPYTATAMVSHALFGTWNIDDSPIALMTAISNQLWSPIFYFQYDWLAQVLGKKVNFSVLQRQPEVPHLYISTTNLTTGSRDIFAKSAVTFEVLKAAASIPQLFPPARYDSSYYWDGGFVGNPPLSPLLSHATDVVIIQLNPFGRATPPRTAMAIDNCLNEVTFNSSMIHEINAIVAVNRLLAQLEPKAKTNPAVESALNLLPVRHINLHRITDEEYLGGLGVASKSVIVGTFLEELHEKGWQSANS